MKTVKTMPCIAIERHEHDGFIRIRKHEAQQYFDANVKLYLTRNDANPETSRSCVVIQQDTEMDTLPVILKVYESKHLAVGDWCSIYLSVLDIDAI